MGTGISGASNSGRARASARVAGSLKNPASAVAALEVRDPDRAVDGRPADRAGALGDDLARAAAQRPLVVDAEEMELRALDRVEHAGVALRGADLADHAVGAVRVPVDRADVLAHQRASAAGHARRHRGRAGRRRRRSCPSPPGAPRSRRGGPRGDTGCSCRPRAYGSSRVAQTSPASTSPLASSTVTPHSRIPSSIAQSSDDGPRSPLGPGCTTRQRCFAQIDSGIIFLSIGHTISCGRCSLTAASIAAAESTTATVTSWPSSVSAIQAR